MTAHKPPIGPVIRLGFGLLLCLFLLGTTLSTGPEESHGCTGHTSGSLTIVNKSIYDATVRLAGPIVTVVFVEEKEIKTIEVRSGLYHWVASFTYGPGFPVGTFKVDSGVVQVDKNGSSQITVEYTDNNTE